MCANECPKCSSQFQKGCWHRSRISEACCISLFYGARCLKRFGVMPIPFFCIIFTKTQFSPEIGLLSAVATQSNQIHSTCLWYLIYLLGFFSLCSWDDNIAWLPYVVDSLRGRMGCCGSLKEHVFRVVKKFALAHRLLHMVAFGWRFFIQFQKSVARW